MTPRGGPADERYWLDLCRMIRTVIFAMCALVLVGWVVKMSLGG